MAGKKISDFVEKIKFRYIFIIPVIFIAAVLIKSYANRIFAYSGEEVRHLEIIGTYSVDGGAEMNLQASAESGIKIPKGCHTVVIKGHLDKNPRAGEKLIVFLKNAQMEMYSDSVLIDSWGDFGKKDMKATGILFRSVDMTGINVYSSIEFVLRNTYAEDSTQFFTSFLKELSYGTGGTVYLNAVSKNAVSVFFGRFCMFLGFISMVIGAIARKNGLKEANQSVFFAPLAIFGGIVQIFDSNYQYMSVLVRNIYVETFIDYGSIPMLLSVAMLLIFSNMVTKRRNIVKLLCFSGAALISVQFGLHFFGICDIVDSYMAGMIVLYFMLVGCLALAASEMRSNESIKVVVAAYIPMVFCPALDVINTFTRLIPERSLMRTGFVITVLMLFVQYLLFIKKCISELRKVDLLKRELVESRMSIALSQIQPHFLFNSLTAIRSLCLSSPERAEQAVCDFSYFLRANLDSLSSTVPIGAAQEIEHVKSYMRLEKMRFGERLNIVYDIQTLDFVLPPLTIQPIAENAVRYGVTKRVGGGTVTVSIHELDDYIQISVTDNGVGFDPNELKNKALDGDGRTHIGIENVRNRLKTQCGGELTIVSQKGIGTTVVMTLDRRKVQK